MKKLGLITLSLLIASGASWGQGHHDNHHPDAHHDHHAAGVSKSGQVGPHGGSLNKALHHIMLELVKKEGGQLQIYPLAMDQSPISTQEVEIKGQLLNPPKSAKDLVFKKQGDHFLMEGGTPECDRCQLKLEVIYKKHKHNVTVKLESGSKT